MLLRTLLLLAFITALSETLLQGAAALARVSLHERAVAAARVGFVSGAARAQQWLAQSIAARSPLSAAAMPSPSAICTIAAGSTCALTVTTTISTPPPNPSATPSACPGTDCVVYLQDNAAVAESRFRVRITSTVTGTSGTVYAVRSGEIAFRTYLTPPYASLAGALEASLDEIAPNFAGDDAGTANGTPTLVKVDYVQPGSGASPLPGNVWQAQAQHPSAPAPAWNP
jgi:hypothetical protein